ncbi:MAG: TolC family protein [Planctomycetota bacterium]
MHPIRSACLCAAAVAATGCQSYTPAPVDVRAHAAEFAERLPDAAAVVAFARYLDPAVAPADADEDAPADSVDLAAARRVALWFHTGLREARARLGIAAAQADHAGRLADPVLGVDLERILENAAHPWLAAGSLALSVPLTGRPGLEQALAQGEHARAWTEVRLAEAAVLDDLDRTWVRCTAAGMRVELLQELLLRLDELQAIADRLAQAQQITAAAARAFALERLARAAELVRAEADAADADAHRNELLGLPPERALAFAPRLQLELRTAPDGDRDAWLEHGPRTARRTAEHRIAEHALELEVAKQWPDLELAPGFGEEDAEPRALLGLRLPLPLWNGNAEGIARARAARIAAATALRADVERALHELRRADRRVAAARAERELIETELVPLAAQQLQDGRRLAELGQLDPLLILDGLSRAHAARMALLDAAVAEAEATAAHNALFWPEPEPAPTAENPPAEDHR